MADVVTPDQTGAGEPLQMKRSTCPACGSANIDREPFRFSKGKAAGGAALVGVPGLLGGFLGRRGLRCRECGEAFPFEHAGLTKSEQTRAIESAQAQKLVVNLTTLVLVILFFIWVKAC